MLGGLAEAEKALRAELDKTTDLDNTVRRLETEVREATRQLTEATAREASLSDKTRDQERDLQLVRTETLDLRAEVKRHRTRARELEEQIQNDDRADRLEATLKNTQDKADDLEFKFSKLQQTYSALKKERDELSHRQEGLAAAETEWRTKHDALQEQHTSVQTQLQSITSEHAALAGEKASLQANVNTSQQSLAESQQQLSQAASELAQSSRQLQSAQNELRQAIRRAEESEKIQKDMQAESARLVKSLEEMRPKIVELSNDKAELLDQHESLKSTLKARDNVISELEATIDELKDGNATAEQRHKDLTAQRQKELASSSGDHHALQQAYESIQRELEETRAGVRALEDERHNHIQSINRQKEELAKQTASTRQSDQLLQGARLELEERRLAETEQREFVERAQAELEAVRAELAARDEEIAHFQQNLHGASSSNSHGSLSDEMQTSYELERSATDSRIRALETSIHDAESRAHALEKRARDAEDELASLRGRANGTASPPLKRPSSRSDSLRRQTLAGTRRASGLAISAEVADSPRQSMDYSMSAEMKAKRRDALRLLQARMESEHVTNGAGSSLEGRLAPIRPQFLDEGHIFWCHSCQGDLVIL
jgi:chromosome segregation ATPase